MIGALLLGLALAADQPLVANVPGGARAQWARGGTPELLVLPRPGDGWGTLAARLTTGAGNAAELKAANDGRARPLSGVRVRVPWELLRPALRVACATSLFPLDRRVEAGWEHEVLAPWGGDGESWWELAQWFCGDGSRYPELRQANPALGLYPAAGSVIVIPAAELRPEFRAVRATRARPRPTAAPAPAATAAPPAPIPTTALPAVAAGPGPTGVLVYRDGEAIYRLRPGEALYSAVVVRFTGQLHASDVNATAREIARRSGIADVTAIPVGYPVQIPFDVLLPEFLPAGNPRRLAWEKEREELAAIKRVIRAANLDGIHVILDAGHGGADTGAVVNDVWESTYVYDVMSRVKRVLEEQTKATVWTTVDNPAFTRRNLERDVLANERDQRLLVQPPYDLSDATTGVHLRWILANSLLQRLKRQKVNPERVAFVSIHADSLHPAVRGLMVYVPSRALRGSHAPWQRAAYSCRETRALSAPRFPPAFRSRAEALSSQLGEAIVHSAERFGIPVHPYQPVRSSVLRGGSRWVPAVLRYTLVPSAVLVEICNLNNEQDRQDLLSWRFREKLAHAIAAGLAEGFSR
ncbi:MAG: N-acetylmuramoyl-L-alanine amidase [Acidobacteria bacterium]|nr:MAG: N-acetylmuramoyl-L-alanine amidase [Acidobacteriota bacterium]